MVNRDNREMTVRYLLQMADEMKKMAEGAFAPSLALLFEMAADEANDFLERQRAHHTGNRQPLIREERDKTAAVTDKVTCKV